MYNRRKINAVFFTVAFSLTGLGLMLVSNKASAQLNNTTVKGSVVSGETGEILPGVFIKNKHSGKGAFSSGTGLFTIFGAIGDTLSFSCVGYTSLQQVVTDKGEMMVALKESIQKLNDVVVIGYGTVKRKDVTGAVAEVNMKDLLKAPVTSFDQALAGRVAGVQVSSNEDQPGAAMNIVIRGGNSITQDNSPLYVIDGFPIEDPGNSALNPLDIASITVLKDASATAIYGSRGANGVVVITTKKGTAGRPIVTYNTSFGYQEVTKKMKMMSPYEFVKYQVELDSLNAPVYLTKPGRTLDDYKKIAPIDWQDLIFKQAPFQTHNLSLTGGNAQTQYAVSGSIADQKGVVINSGYKRYQGRVSLDQVITPKLKAGVNLNYTNEMNYGQLSSSMQATGTGYSTYTMYRIWGYRPVTGGADIIDNFMDDEEIAVGDARINPLISLENEIREEHKKNIVANAYLSYNIMDGLDLQVRGGIINRVIKDEEFYNSKTGRGYPDNANLKGVNGGFEYSEMNDWMNENTLTYKKDFNKNNSLNVVAGFTMQGQKDAMYGYTATLVPNEGLGLSGMDDGVPGALDALLTDNVLISYLGRVNYSLMSRYLFTATFRADGSSKFAPENRWGYFPSAAFAWRMSEESFMKNLTFISDAKLRMSYGVTGNNRIGDFSRYSSLALPYAAYYSFNNGTPAPGAVPDKFGNNDLKWESTAQSDLGLSLSLFKGRINFEGDVYSKTTKDLLLNANVPTSSGYSSIYKNVGTIRNQGLELALSTVNIKTKKFTWSSDFNISFNKNKIIDLAEGEEKIFSDVSWTSTYNNQFLYMASLGGSASSFFGYVWDGVYQYADFDKQANGAYTLKKNVTTNGTDRASIQPGDIKYKDVNDDGVVDSKDMVVIGRGLPIHYGGFNNNFRYGSFSLNVFLQWSYGNDIYNANRIMFEGNSEIRSNLNQYASYADRWSPDNQDSKNYRVEGQGVRGIYSSRVLEDGSYLRLKTVSLSYMLPAEWMKRVKMQGVEVSVAAQNLYTWTNYSGMDPEVSVRNSPLTPGFDYSAYPRSKTITFGLKATF